jgi:hypothetical protein
MRVVGDPPSGNGASSFHLWWELSHGERLSEAAATLEIVEPPSVNRLYFWALQVSFVEPDGGGAHLGLQHHPRFPGRTAANWGGYAPSHEGGLLRGSESPLPSTPGDVNTRDFPWQAHRPYRLRVWRAEHTPGPGRMHAWRGEITDLATGAVTVVRDLYSHGKYLRGPVMWTESFARCDQPSVAVRWSDLSVVAEEGRTIPVTTVSVNYQRHDAGGCDNTNASLDGVGWVQRTSTERIARTGERLSLGSRPEVSGDPPVPSSPPGV